jgi:DNA-directed RNA polymerase specialized sigma24 family protein
MKTSNLRTIWIDKDTDRERPEEFEDLVRQACGGDRWAFDVITFAYGPSLLEEARQVLGPYRDYADDLVRDFLLSLSEGRRRFVPKYRDGVRWMFRIVRLLAREYVQLHTR